MEVYVLLESRPGEEEFIAVFHSLEGAKAHVKDRDIAKPWFEDEPDHVWNKEGYCITKEYVRD